MELVIKRRLQRLRSLANRMLSAARLRAIGGQARSVPPDGLLLFCKARNEAPRLRAFLDSYFKLGVAHVILIDNGSTDETAALAAAEPRCTVYRTEEPLARHPNWFAALLSRHAVGRWCLVADLDEFFVYPNLDVVDLPGLCRFLDETDHDAMASVMIDLYSDRPLHETRLQAGEHPLTVCRHFDPHVYRSGPNATYTGGVRERFFKVGVCLSKVPLFKYRPGLTVSSGFHQLRGARIAPLQAALLHFKFFDDFHERAVNAVQRGVYWQGAKEYKAYLDVLATASAVTLYDARHSALYAGPESLLTRGLMRSSPEFDAWAARKV